MKQPSTFSFRCRTCHGIMRKNYDHVGDCATGNCSGTFTHVRTPGLKCADAAWDVGHDAVEVVRS